jgi:hypothetical protein
MTNSKSTNFAENASWARTNVANASQFATTNDAVKLLPEHG